MAAKQQSTRWKIFSRFMAGYMVLLVLAMCVTVFAVLKLREVRNITQSIIDVDSRMLDIYKNLSDHLLSEQRYEKKYFIIQDRSLYRSFLLSGDEFLRYHAEAVRMADTAEMKTALERAARLHARYRSLIAANEHCLQQGTSCSATDYERQSEKIISELIDQLIQVKSLSQRSVTDKVKNLHEAGSRAFKLALSAAAAALVMGVVFSLLLTARITRSVHERERELRTQ